MKLNERKPSLGKNFDHVTLDQNGKTMVEYVWIGGLGDDLRSKSKTYTKPIYSIEDLDEWNYDGSSTRQATTNDSEVLIRPVAIFDDPFTLRPNKICLCETYYNDGTPTNTNFRHFASRIFNEKAIEQFDPWFGIEQEYALMKTLGNDCSWPYGWPIGSYPTPQGRYYCSVGNKNTYGRDIVYSHYKACLYAGVKIYGTNAEVMPGQWEFQIGTCNGIEIGDHLWMARYLLQRVGEMYGVDITFEPKPVPGDWNGSGGHTNYSDNITRNDTNMEGIYKQMEKMKANHSRMVKLYGEGNEQRLTGYHETSSLSSFSHGVASRGCSVRIPRTTEKSGKGYWEDRRPAANLDPYVVSSALFSTTCLDSEGLNELEAHYLKFLDGKKQNHH